MPRPPRFVSAVRLLVGLAIAAAAAIATVQAQIPGRNVNMVSGVTWPEGDPFLQRQNEPSIAASTRNPLHLLGGSNDYRTVDVPFPADGDNETGDAWLGLFKSTDGGQRWTSSLLPGYPQDQSEAGLASPLKAYTAGADAVVRAGTNGLVYFSGLAFVRGEGGKSGIFLSRFIDNNNQEAGDPFAYLGTVMVAQSTPGVFLDKPWMVVDVPRGDAATCTITANDEIEIGRRGRARWNRDNRDNRGGGRARKAPRPAGQRIKAGAVYVAYTSFTGEGASLRSEILMTRSVDCGASWSKPFRISNASDPLNQGASLTIDPRDGSVFVAWRRFANAARPDDDGIMVAKLPYGGKKADAPGQAYKFPKRRGQKVGQSLHRIFEHGRVKARPQELADIAEFDQGSSPYSFRTNAYPTTATDGAGRVYVAWTQRGFPADSRPDTGPADGARIVMVTTRNGRSFTQPQAVDDYGQKGHQLMPSLAFAGGKLMLVYYDLRETRANVHGYRVSELDGLFGNGLRHTIDIRAAMASPGDYPAFAPSVRVSEYLMGVNSNTSRVEQLQVNPPNLPMFRQGTTPFMGDYIDVAPAPAFVPTRRGGWAFNTADTGAVPTFHAAWTDNRDVRPPAYDTNGDGNPWNDYTAAQMSPATGPSVFDGTTLPQCVPGNAGSRNQNVYSARITGGLLAGSPGNAKPLSPTLQRGFVVFAQNATPEPRRFRMTIRSQPVGGRASFEQFSAPGQPPLTSIEMSVPPRSTASRTVYATSTDPNAMIPVDVVETTPPDATGTPVSKGLTSTVILNPDIENPDIENPDIENPDIENPDIENTEVYNPDIENPDIENPDIENVRVANPDIENPDIENPDIENPDIENVRVANPDIENITVTNPDIENPDIENPDIENPDIENPDIENGAVADVTWKVSNTGNTTAAFNVNVFLAAQNLPAGVKTQLVLYKTYRTPVTVPNGCQLGFQTRNVLVSSILNPVFIRPDSGGVPDQNDPAETNASMWLAPGEEGRITLRVIHDDLPPNFEITDADGNTKTVRIDPAFAPTTSATPTISSQGVGTEDAGAGRTDPPLVTPTGANLFFLQMPTDAVVGTALSPTVRVQVRDNLTGTPVAGATTTLTLANNPGEAFLTGNVAVSGVDGIATFPALSVSATGAGYTLLASATTSGVTATALSTPFTVFGSTVVVNTNDTGLGSLRAAILNSNAQPGVQTISFNIPGPGPHVISPATALPDVLGPVVIDGTTQPGYGGSPVIEIQGPGPDGGFFGGVRLVPGGSTLRGLSVTGFRFGAIESRGNPSLIEDNWIGVRPDRSEYGNGSSSMGVYVVNSSGNVIRRNVIGGGHYSGVFVWGGADNRIENNLIGTDPDGRVGYGNQRGVTLEPYAGTRASGTVIAGNLISGNAGPAIVMNCQGTTPDLCGAANTRIVGNTVGLNADGEALANGSGIRIVDGPGTVIGAPGAGNVISGNNGVGITVDGTLLPMPVIQANYIGTDPSGEEARSNNNKGIQLNGPAQVGGTGAGEGNLIAAHGNAAGGAGIIVGPSGGGAVVLGNVLGLSASGETLGNGYSGITVSSLTGVTIGGAAPGARNVISGNGLYGISIIQAFGGAFAAPAGTIVQGNYIGTDAAGTAPKGNLAAGILVRGTNHRIGGDGPGEANVIAFNGSGESASVGGILLSGPALQVSIEGNRIHSNTGLGIDLNSDGVTANDTGDGDTGPNGLQNFPVLANARVTGPNTLVDFNLASFVPGIYTLRFYANQTCDPSGHGEGAQLAGVVTVDTAAGVTGSMAMALYPGGYAFTATATDSIGNTSEYSACASVPAAPWSASGSGTTTLVDDGSTGQPKMTYNNPGVFSGAWSFSTTAASTGIQKLSYDWSGFHSYFMVSTRLEAFVNRGGSDVFVVTLVDEPLDGEGPVVCCAFPSGGFTYAGATALPVQAGDIYGFRMQGGHGDGTYALNGALNVTVGGTPQFVLNVRGTAGGFENQTPGFGPSSVPARVYGGTLAAGQQVTVVSATGTVSEDGGLTNVGPAGIGACAGACLIPGAPRLALVARVAGGAWQLVGTGPTVVTAGAAGLLEFAVNDDVTTDNTGGFVVTVAWQP